MRKYAMVSPRFWIGATGKLLRKNPDAQRIALYLITCPTSEMTGVFYCPLASIENEVGIAPSKPLQRGIEGVKKGLQTLQEVGFCFYDYESEYVFVREMARFQIAERLSEKDNRVKAVKSAIESMPYVLAEEFKRRYNEDFSLGFEISPSEAPSKGLRSQEQEQEQEQDIKEDANASFVQAADATLTLSESSKVEKKEKSIFETCPYREIIDSYHEILPMLPKVLWEVFKDNQQRKSTVKARWIWFTRTQECKTIEDGIQEFKNVFQMVRHSDFLIGEKTDWKCDFDWIMTRRNFEKILERRYLNGNKH